jgi:hypothetical protein
MLIKSDFDIHFQLTQQTAMVAMLHLHPSLEGSVRHGNVLVVEHLGWNVSPGYGELIGTQEYHDSFGNRCSRFLAPAGHLRLSGTSTIDVDGMPEPVNPNLQQAPIQDLPDDVLQFLLPSRYCEVDRFVQVSHDLFGWMKPGWERAAAIRDWVHEKVRFDYQTARPTKTAMDVFTERVGVCRDFQHLAVTLSRCQNIPARYVTGYLGDIRWPYTGAGDFSAWYEVWLDERCAAGTRTDGNGTRCGRCCHHDFVWERQPDQLLCGEHRSTRGWQRCPATAGWDGAGRRLETVLL